MPLMDHWAEVLYKLWDRSHDSCIQYVPSFHLPSSLLIITSSPSQKQVRIQLNDDPEQQVGAPVRPAPSPTPAQQPPSTHNHLLHGLTITDETRMHLALESCSSSHTHTSNVKRFDWLVTDDADDQLVHVEGWQDVDDVCQCLHFQAIFFFYTYRINHTQLWRVHGEYRWWSRKI